jgi:microcompartment protein CcmL/EutN
VNILEARTICPGKYMILITGDVASVESSMKAGLEAGAGFIVDELFLPMLHEDVIPAITGKVKCEDWESVGIIETFSVVSSIEAADMAAKVGGVKIIEVRLSMGYGGKSYIKIMGTLEAVEEAMKAGVSKAEKKGLLCKDIIIPKPHEEIKSFFM